MMSSLPIVGRLFKSSNGNGRANRPAARSGLEISKQGMGKYTALGYRAATVANREGRSATGGSADYHGKTHRKQLLHQSREFYRDNGLYAGIVRRAVTNAVRTGFSLQAKTKSVTWNRKAEALFTEWSKKENCDIRGMFSFRHYEQTLCRELFQCGDTGVLLLAKEMKLQAFEAEQISEGASRANDLGMKLNEYGKPTAYALLPYNSNGQLQGGKAKWKPAKDFMFLANLERSSQSRGVPPLEASFPMLHRVNDTCDSEALAYQLLSRLALSMTHEGGGESGKETSIDDPDRSAADDDGALTSRITEMAYAIIFHGKPGEKVAGVDRNIPGKDFTATIRMFLRLLGLPIGMPLELVLLDFSQTNYSSYRGAVMQAQANFEDWQTTLEEGFHRRVYPWLIDRWIKERQLTDRADKHVHRWQKPPFPWLDPEKEAKAWKLLRGGGMETYAASLKSRGNEHEDTVEALEQEVIRAIKAAKKVEKETGQKTDWRLFAGLEAKVMNSPTLPGNEPGKDGEEKPEPKDKPVDEPQDEEDKDE